MTKPTTDHAPPPPEAPMAKPAPPAGAVSDPHGVLAQVRRALGRPELTPHHAPSAHLDTTSDHTAHAPIHEALALARPAPPDLITAFTTAARALGAEVHLDPDLPALLAALSDELRTHRGLPADHPIAIATPASGIDPFAADLTVVPAALGIATLGAVLLDGPRLLPVSAEITVVTLAAPDVVATLHDALRLHRPGATRLIMAGPSKTADIEGVLVTGVHGPRRVIVALGLSAAQSAADPRS